MRQALGDAGRPAAGVGAVRGQVLDAGHDGDRPQRRAQRRVACTGWPAQAGNERFAWDSYRRLIQMFGKTVLRIDGRARSSTRSTSSSAARASPSDLDLDAADLQQLVGDVQGDRRRGAGAEFPQDPREQLTAAIGAVFDVLELRARACSTAARNASRSDLGTAVNVVAMVFGNLGDDSGTGVCFTRDPATGAQGVYGDYLPERPGRGRGRRASATRCRWTSWSRSTSAPTTSCWRSWPLLESPLPRPVRHRVHHRARQAVDAADPGRQAHRGGGVPDRHPAGRRGPDRRRRGAAAGVRRPAGPVDVPAVRPTGRHACSARGMPASPGAAVGMAVFDSLHRGDVEPPRREGHPGPQGDQPRRPARHDRRAGHPHQPGRQDQPRRRRRPRHGQDLRVRRRGARRRHQAPAADHPGRHRRSTRAT